MTKGCIGPLIRFFLLLLPLQVFWTESEPVPGAVDNQSPAAVYKRAEQLSQAGKRAAALEELRVLWLDFPDNGWLERSLLLSARIALELKESYKARYFLKKLVTESFRENEVKEGAFLLAEILYQDKLFAEAVPYYQLGLRLAEKTGTVQTGIAAKALFRLAQIACYQQQDYDLARNFLSRLNRALLAREESAAYTQLQFKLSWQQLAPGDLGVEDGNISAIAVDGDDLWVGTWSGGLARYSYSTGRITLYEAGRQSITDNAIRAIAIDNKRVWVGTYDGLAVYAKADSTWTQIKRFGSQRPGKIAVLKIIDSVVYAGTLGNGLWKFEHSSWQQAGDVESPGSYILSLADNRDNIYIGTMTKGIFILNKKSSEIRNFDLLTDRLIPRNITMLLFDSQQRLWIGTYGEGLVMWDGPAAGLTFYTTDTGEIQDNWVLCGVETADHLYFGTFGGGAARLDKQQGQWQHLGMQEGLASPDIATLAYSRPSVYFGTLGAGISIYRESTDD